MVSAWSYRGATAAGIREVGVVEGREVALPPHFHDEDQFTFVTVGRRRFLIDGRAHLVEAGEGVLIPAGTVHASLDTPGGVACLNIYAAPGLYACGALLHAARERWSRGEEMTPQRLADLVAVHRVAADGGVSPRAPSLRESVAVSAIRAGVSREHFSRTFARTHGLPPHRFGLLNRLNLARDHLRRGGALASVALEAGFADQSHFGRCFRKAFGVTPGRFRAGWVTNVPDARFRSG